MKRKMHSAKGGGHGAGGKGKGPHDKSKMISMMGGKPFAKGPKKPEPDDKPHMKPGAKSVDHNAKSQHSKRTKRLTGLML